MFSVPGFASKDSFSSPSSNFFPQKCAGPGDDDGSSVFSLKLRGFSPEVLLRSGRGKILTSCKVCLKSIEVLHSRT